MNASLIETWSAPVPRYTSYPTAPHFHAGVDAGTYEQWLAALPDGASVSLYLHVPFCDRLCWFCACHTRQTLRYEPIATYLGALRAEIDLVAARIAPRVRVTSIHLGGGSPTLLRPADLEALIARLRSRMRVARDATIGIEIDANDIEDEKLDALARAGVNRASLGVQDFNDTVQQAINRIQSFERTRDVIEGLRARGIGAINLDMLYGLPHQTEASVLATAEKVLALSPDRVALFGYAHVPWMKIHQRMIEEASLPGPVARFEQARLAGLALAAGGLDPVGMDHFARPGDPLALAATEGRLRRNFQGYTTDTADALIGLGASAIGRLPQGFVQNHTPTAHYIRTVGQGRFPVTRGLALDADDIMRAQAIERVMCDFALSRSMMTERFGARAQALFADAEAFLADHGDGLFERDGDLYRTTAKGRPFVRHLAAAFDAWRERGTARHSIAV